MSQINVDIISGYTTDLVEIKSRVAEGLSTIASGNYSHAEGNTTTASGNYSHAEGYSTIASGFSSHAGGEGSVASGVNSFIHSTSSIVTGARSVVLGGVNITGSTADTVYVPKLEVAETNEGIIMKSPDGTRYKVTVANGGTISIVLV